MINVKWLENVIILITKSGEHENMILFVLLNTENISWLRVTDQLFSLIWHKKFMVFFSCQWCVHLSFIDANGFNELSSFSTSKSMNDSICILICQRIYANKHLLVTKTLVFYFTLKWIEHYFTIKISDISSKWNGESQWNWWNIKNKFSTNIFILELNFKRNWINKTSEK